MKPFFDSPENIEALKRAAASWLGTPFAGNCSAKGRGVSCQCLAAEVYKEAGFDVGQVPEAPMVHAKYSDQSLIEPWVEAHPNFERARFFQPGNLLGFRLGKCLHHVGIQLDGQKFVHVVDGAGVIISTLADATWGGRVLAMWRPIK